MIADLLAYLRDGWHITNIVPWKGSHAWRIAKEFDVRYVALSDGWVIPQ